MAWQKASANDIRMQTGRKGGRKPCRYLDANVCGGRKDQCKGPKAEPHLELWRKSKLEGGQGG